MPTISALIAPALLLVIKKHKKPSLQLGTPVTSTARIIAAKSRRGTGQIIAHVTRINVTDCPQDTLTNTEKLMIQMRHYEPPHDHLGALFCRYQQR